MTRRRIILKQQSLSASENRDASKHLTFNLLCILLQEANKQLTIQCKNKSGRSLAYKYSRLSSNLSPLETLRFAERETRAGRKNVCETSLLVRSEKRLLCSLAG